MKQRIILLVAAMCLLPNLHFAATTAFDSETPTAISGDTVMSDIPDSIAPYELIEGLSASDMANVPNYEMFMSSLYLGWGSAHFDAASRPAFKSTVFEAGILNFAAFGYVFLGEGTEAGMAALFGSNSYLSGLPVGDPRNLNVKSLLPSGSSADP